MKLTAFAFAIAFLVLTLCYDHQRVELVDALHHIDVLNHQRDAAQSELDVFKKQQVTDCGDASGEGWRIISVNGSR